MARVNEGPNSFNCHPHVYPKVKWTIPARRKTTTKHGFWPNFEVSVPSRFTEFYRIFELWWWHRDKVECVRITTNLRLSNIAKSVSIFKRLDGEVVSTIIASKSVTKKQSRTFHPLWRVKSAPHHTRHGDRGCPYHYCTSKMFGIQCIVSPLWGAENLGTVHRRGETPVTPKLLEQISSNLNG